VRRGSRIVAVVTRRAGWQPVGNLPHIGCIGGIQ
jgi:hypothetical protein